MSVIGAAPGAAVPVSPARAEASRRNGARSRGPKTAEGKARSALNALKHGMRAQRYVVLPDESAVDFAALQTALFAELAPDGALQLVLARRIAIAAWRLARADRLEVELFAEGCWDRDDPIGLALIRDGNGTRSFDTLLRYRNAASAEFTRALGTLKALQAEQAAAGEETIEVPPERPHAPAPLASPPASNQPEPAPGAAVIEVSPERPHTPASLASRPAPNEPERRSISENLMPEQSGTGRSLRDAAAPDPRAAKRTRQPKRSSPARRSMRAREPGGTHGRWWRGPQCVHGGIPRDAGRCHSTGPTERTRAGSSRSRIPG